MSRDAPWFRFYVDDWIAGTSSLTAAEKGVYISLLAAMYDRREPIIGDPIALARRCGLPYNRFVPVLDRLVRLGKITRLDDGRLWNERVKKETLQPRPGLEMNPERQKRITKSRARAHVPPITRSITRRGS